MCKRLSGPRLRCRMCRPFLSPPTPRRLLLKRWSGAWIHSTAGLQAARPVRAYFHKGLVGASQPHAIISHYGPSDLAFAGALDCLRSGKTEQARARLNIALLQADQCSIDKGSWLLAQELSLEVSPPMSSFRKHDGASSSSRSCVQPPARPSLGGDSLGQASRGGRSQAPPKDQNDTGADAPTPDKPPRKPRRQPPNTDA